MLLIFFFVYACCTSLFGRQSLLPCHTKLHTTLGMTVCITSLISNKYRMQVLHSDNELNEAL